MTTKTLLPATWERSLSALAAIAVALLFSSCAHIDQPEPKPEPEPPVAEKKPPPEPVKPPPSSRLYEWYGSDDYVTRIEVSINEQKARFYSGDKEVGWTTVASGVYKYPTPVGSFAVLEKVQNKKSNLYGRIYNKDGKLVKRNAKMGVDSIPEGGRFKGAPMPFFMRLTNDGIGMHAGPIPRPGNRASHGCIRMPKKFAPVLYRYVDVGTPVTVKGKGPSYSRYLAKQRKSAPKPAPAAVARADQVPATNETPATVTTEGSADRRPVAASEGVAAASQAAEVAASSPVAAEATIPVPNSAGSSAITPASGVAPSAGTADAADPTAAAQSDPSPPTTPAETPSSAPAAVVPDSSASALSEVSASSPPDSSDSVPASAPTTSSPVEESTESPASSPVERTMDASLSPEPSGGQRRLPVETPVPPAAEAMVHSEG